MLVIQEYPTSDVGMMTMMLMYKFQQFSPRIPILSPPFLLRL